jgi:hypothetical protein
MSAPDVDARREHLYIFFVAFLAVALPAILYSFRSLDDNRLVSWGMMSGLIQPSLPLVGILLSIPVSYVLSGFRLPGPVLLFPLAFLASALFWDMPETIVDASRYFTQAKHLAVYGPGFFISQWGGEIDAWTDLPAMSFLYGLIFKYAGEVRLYAQVLNSILFASTVSVAALLGSELWDRKTGDMAGTLLLAVPYLFTQTPLLLVDIGSMAFLTIAAYLFLIALRRGGTALVFTASLAIFLAFFSKYSVWLMLSILGVEFLLMLRESPTAVLRRGGLVALLFGLLAGPVLFYHSDIIREQLIILKEFQQPGLRAWEESFTSTFLFHTHPFVAVGAICSVFLALIRRDPKYLIAAWLLLFFVPGMQIRRIRYLVPVFPMLAIMAAYGMSVIGQERVRRFIVYCAATGSIAVALTAYMPFLQTNSIANLKEAGKFMDSMDAGFFKAETLPQRSTINPAIAIPLLDLYTQKPIYYTYAPESRLRQEEIEKMSLRFTWNYKNPAYYFLPDDTRPEALVMIWGYGEPYPRGYELVRKFDKTEKIYSFRPYVSIFLPQIPPR